MARLLFLAFLAAAGSAGPFQHCYGLEYRLTLMPDGIQKKEGRQAVYERSDRTWQKPQDVSKWPINARRQVDCGTSEVTEAELAAFKKELAEAKAAWPKLKAE